jgi:hypothetical protein
MVLDRNRYLITKGIPNLSNDLSSQVIIGKPYNLPSGHTIYGTIDKQLKE